MRVTWQGLSIVYTIHTTFHLEIPGLGICSTHTDTYLDINDLSTRLFTLAL